MDLIEKLEELKTKIDEDYAHRIEQSENARMWDQYETRCLEMISKVDDVISYARSYLNLDK